MGAAAGGQAGAAPPAAGGLPALAGPRSFSSSAAEADRKKLERVLVALEKELGREWDLSKQAGHERVQNVLQGYLRVFEDAGQTARSERGSTAAAAPWRAGPTPSRPAPPSTPLRQPAWETPLPASRRRQSWSEAQAFPREGAGAQAARPPRPGSPSQPGAAEPCLSAAAGGIPRLALVGLQSPCCPPQPMTWRGPHAGPRPPATARAATARGAATAPAGGQGAPRPGAAERPRRRSAGLWSTSRREGDPPEMPEHCEEAAVAKEEMRLNFVASCELLNARAGASSPSKEPLGLPAPLSPASALLDLARVAIRCAPASGRPEPPPPPKPSAAAALLLTTPARPCAAAASAPGVPTQPPPRRQPRASVPAAGPGEALAACASARRPRASAPAGGEQAAPCDVGAVASPARRGARRRPAAAPKGAQPARGPAQARSGWEWPLTRPDKQARVIEMNNNLVQSNYSILRQHMTAVHRRWAEREHTFQVGTLDWPLSATERRVLFGKREQDLALAEHLDLLEKIGELHRECSRAA